MLRETQKVTELKNNIHSLVDESKSVKLLQKVENDLKAEKNDWWDELPTEEQKRITKALKNAKSGKNLISHEDAVKRIKHII